MVRKIVAAGVVIILMSIGLILFVYPWPYQSGPVDESEWLHMMADHVTFCQMYVGNDTKCNGENGKPVNNVSRDVIDKIRATCLELNKRYNFEYRCTQLKDELQCIQDCCDQCPK